MCIRDRRNRFVHLELEADLSDWCRWAVGASVRPEIIAFLRFKPDLLHAADTTSDANAWPTPRSWEMASHVLCGVARRQNTAFLTGAGEFEAQLLDGTVGQAASAELLAFLRLFRQLPSIDEILLNPESAPLPTEPSAQIAIDVYKRQPLLWLARNAARMSRPAWPSSRSNPSLWSAHCAARSAAICRPRSFSDW